MYYSINKIEQMGKQIAKYLNFTNPELYCFCRSSVTGLVDNITSLKITVGANQLQSLKDIYMNH